MSPSPVPAYRRPALSDAEQADIRRESDVWERFIDAGVEAGVPLTVLNDLYRKYCNAPAKAIRPNSRKFSRRGTGPVALPGEPI